MLALTRIAIQGGSGVAARRHTHTLFLGSNVSVTNTYQVSHLGQTRLEAPRANIS